MDRRKAFCPKAGDKQKHASDRQLQSDHPDGIDAAACFFHIYCPERPADCGAESQQNPNDRNMPAKARSTNDGYSRKTEDEANHFHYKHGFAEPQSRKYTHQNRLEEDDCRKQAGRKIIQPDRLQAVE